MKKRRGGRGGRGGRDGRLIRKSEPVRLDVLAALEEQRRKSQQQQQPQQPQQPQLSTLRSQPRVSSTVESLPRSIPGFFYDAEKKRYFPNSMRRDIGCEKVPTASRSLSKNRSVLKPASLPLFLLQRKYGKDIFTHAFHPGFSSSRSDSNLHLEWSGICWQCFHPLESGHIRCIDFSSNRLLLGYMGSVRRHYVMKGMFHPLCDHVCNVDSRNCEIVSVCDDYGLVCAKGRSRLVRLSERSGLDIPLEGELMCLCRSDFVGLAGSPTPLHSTEGSVLVCGDRIHLFLFDSHPSSPSSPSSLHLQSTIPLPSPSPCVCVWSYRTCRDVVCGLRDGQLLLLSSLSSSVQSLWKFKHCVRGVYGCEMIPSPSSSPISIFTHVRGICGWDIHGKVVIGLRLSLTDWIWREVRGLSARSVWCDENGVVCVCEDGVWVVDWYGKLVRRIYDHCFQHVFICGNTDILLLVESSGVIHWCSRSP